MSERSDIMRGSKAWDVVTNGVPEGISPQELRTMLHAYHQLFQVMIPKIDETRDSVQILSKEDEDIRTDVGRLERRIFDGETGLIAKMSKRYITLLTSVLILVLGVAISIARGVTGIA